jgi:hypothetical protein
MDFAGQRIEGLLDSGSRGLCQDRLIQRAARWQRRERGGNMGLVWRRGKTRKRARLLQLQQHRSRRVAQLRRKERKAGSRNTREHARDAGLCRQNGVNDTRRRRA